MNVHCVMSSVLRRPNPPVRLPEMPLVDGNLDRGRPQLEARVSNRGPIWLTPRSLLGPLLKYSRAVGSVFPNLVDVEHPFSPSTLAHICQAEQATIYPNK